MNVGAFKSSRTSNTSTLSSPFYCTGLDLRKVYIQFKASCLERSVHSWYGVILTLLVSLFFFFWYMYVFVRGKNSTCGINLFIFKSAVLRMGEHSSLLLWPHMEASLENSNMPCQMNFFQQWTLAINCQCKTWKAQNWTVVSCELGIFTCYFLLIHR